MKVLVTIDVFGTSVDEEFEVDNIETIDLEIEEYVRSEISYDYEIIEEDEEK
ncbi:hypothetical protein [Bacillus cereus group sp. BfR-BA-01380]|uniref:hypothetical protein n=1 Tax=Bacillus cereus group sp. BfR-BA-01380 TaxID=2920324 RepID=UPI001F574D86|nr:hypothetical protein [Bacillus cereus group sp. BfR-BA-01380]